jgi:hypothetical protein
MAVKDEAAGKSFEPLPIQRYNKQIGYLVLILIASYF